MNTNEDNENGNSDCARDKIVRVDRLPEITSSVISDSCVHFLRMPPSRKPLMVKCSDPSCGWTGGHDQTVLKKETGQMLCPKCLEMGVHHGTLPAKVLELAGTNGTER